MWLVVFFLGASSLLAFLAWQFGSVPKCSPERFALIEQKQLPAVRTVQPLSSITKREKTKAFDELLLSWDPQRGLQGYLWKKSSNIFRGWQKRFFETDFRWLVYYRSRRCASAIIDLSRVRNVTFGAQAISLRFSESRTMQLRACSEDECRRWGLGLAEAVRSLHSIGALRSPQIKQEFCPVIEEGDLAGMRLNNFADIPSLNFGRDILSKISASEQSIFRDFSRLMDVAMRQLLQSRAVDPSRFYQSPDDFTKLRFLQSDKFDISKALRRLSETVVWRQASGLDDFITSPDRGLLTRYRNLRVRRIIGTDKLGRPLLVERLGEFMGSDEAYLGLSLEQYLTCYAYDGSQIFACFRRQALKDGRYNHSVSYIADISGLKFSTTMKMVPFFTALTEVVERHFVEIGGPCLILNAPSIVVNMLWPLYRKSLDESIASKVTICGQDGDVKVETLFGAVNAPLDFCGLMQLTIPHVPQRVDVKFDAQFPRNGLFKGLARVPLLATE